MGDPHVVLELGHVLFGSRFLGERPGQHEFGLEQGSRPLHDAVEGCRHPWNGGMLDPPLDLSNAPAGVALIPTAVELFGGGPELDNEIPGQILRVGLAPLLAPQMNKSRLVAAHDNPGVGPADEGAALRLMLYFLAKGHCSLLGGFSSARSCSITEPLVLLSELHDPFWIIGDD